MQEVEAGSTELQWALFHDYSVNPVGSNASFSQSGHREDTFVRYCRLANLHSCSWFRSRPWPRRLVSHFTASSVSWPFADPIPDSAKRHDQINSKSIFSLDPFYCFLPQIVVDTKRTIVSKVKRRLRKELLKLERTENSLVGKRKNSRQRKPTSWICVIEGWCSTSQFGECLFIALLLCVW